MLYFVLRYFREIIIAILLVLCIGISGKYNVDKSKFEKELEITKSTLTKKYDDLVIKYQNESLESKDRIIKKQIEYQNSLSKIEENYRNEIKNINADRIIVDSTINSLSEAVKRKTNSNNTTNTDNNSQSTNGLYGGGLQGTMSDLFIMCTQEYARMGEEADRLKQSVITLDASWHEMANLYNEKDVKKE